MVNLEILFRIAKVLKVDVKELIYVGRYNNLTDL